jgi:hypothetical protein
MLLWLGEQRAKANASCHSAQHQEAALGVHGDGPAQNGACTWDVFKGCARTWRVRLKAYVKPRE